MRMAESITNFNYNRKSTFASALDAPQKLAFNSAGNLLVVNIDGTVDEFTTNSAQSTFASEVSGSGPLAFENITLPVPEPSALGLFAVGFAALQS
jgi:hypothetical protein